MVAVWWTHRCSRLPLGLARRGCAAETGHPRGGPRDPSQNLGNEGFWEGDYGGDPGRPPFWRTLVSSLRGGAGPRVLKDQHSTHTVTNRDRYLTCMGIDLGVLHWTLGSGASACYAQPIPLFAKKLARALAGRPIRALIGIIHLVRGKRGCVTMRRSALHGVGRMSLCRSEVIAHESRQSTRISSSALSLW
jgi:hypothetical protein